MKKRSLTVALSALLVVSAAASMLTACGNKSNEANNTENAAAESSESNTSIANPWSDYDSLEAAESAVGFDFSFGDVIGNGKYYAEEFRAMEGMLEITYYTEDGSDFDDQYMIRQAKKTDEDISGDYTSYSHDFTIDDCGINEIRLRGTKDTLAVCSFNYGDYSYVIYPGLMDYNETFLIIGEMTGVESTEYPYEGNSDENADGENADGENADGESGEDESGEGESGEGESGEGAPIVEDDRMIDEEAIDTLAIAGSYSTEGISSDGIVSAETGSSKTGNSKTGSSDNGNAAAGEENASDVIGHIDELSLSMYTSTDDNYVGVLEIIDTDGNMVYTGEIQEIMTNYYGLVDDDVNFTVYTDQDALCLDLYINGQHAAYLVMTEHYES